MNELRKQIAARVARMFSSREDADDAAQEAIVRLLAARQGGRVIRNELAFAMRTAIRVAIDHRRQSDGQLRILRTAPRDTAVVADDAVQPDEVRHLYAAVAALPAKQAAVITLRKLMEWEYAEVAAVLDISQESCRTHCKLGLQRLKKMLADKGTLR